METTHPIPSLDEIAAVVGGDIARDGGSVVVGYGPLGYLRLTPDYVISGGREVPAAKIAGRLRSASGAKHAELRAKLEAAGIYPC